ncbi:hypothetical protein BASA61_006956 [Batrachochytrium salamandrivorans]|nr:hypothetical protein BASA62_005146 [Batrachochytrium salamandrivorans]KAH6585228.1 hypothetical protein BASA61_006956 [Batrachochytrium salamandrivorans]KAH9273373.1 hypothetical protein BASA83_004375 [Batrachochytrium salamandrivorans]
MVSSESASMSSAACLELRSDSSCTLITNQPPPPQHRPSSNHHHTQQETDEGMFTFDKDDEAFAAAHRRFEYSSEGTDYSCYGNDVLAPFDHCSTSNDTHSNSSNTVAINQDLLLMSAMAHMKSLDTPLFQVTSPLSEAAALNSPSSYPCLYPRLSLSRTSSNDTNASDVTVQPNIPSKFRHSFDSSHDKVVDIHNFAASDADEVENVPVDSASLSASYGGHHRWASATDAQPVLPLTTPRPSRRAVSLGDFTLLRVIGCGAYGKVFLVRRKDHALDQLSLLASAAKLESSSAIEDNAVANITTGSSLHRPSASKGIAINKGPNSHSLFSPVPATASSLSSSTSSSSAQRRKVSATVQSNLFAMKVLRKASIVLHGKDAEHTQNERSILEAVRHPFIVKLMYAFQTPEKLYLILSYASGGELFTYLAQERMFSESVACFYISELLLAIEHLHLLGIIYRDLKPENVLLDADGHVILTDFGLSKVAVGASTICGTVEFMAPEIIDERPEYGNEVDYWSLGVMLYDMLTGSPPFSGGNRKKIMESILKKKPTFPKYMTSESRDLCNKLLKKNPEQRLGTGEGGSLKVKNHLFFRKIAWKKLLAKEIPPPYVPKLSSADDTSNFQAEFTTMPLSDSPPTSGEGILRPSQVEKFLGFSFVAETIPTID